MEKIANFCTSLKIDLSAFLTMLEDCPQIIDSLGLDPDQDIEILAGLADAHEEPDIPQAMECDATESASLADQLIAAQEIEDSRRKLFALKEQHRQLEAHISQLEQKWSLSSTASTPVSEPVPAPVPEPGASAAAVPVPAGGAAAVGANDLPTEAIALLTASKEAGAEITKNLNSQKERPAYMRFLRRMSTKTMKANNAELVERFNDKNKRSELFVDFFLCKEDVSKVKIMHTRRHILRKSASLVFRPMSEADILAKFHGDQEHTDKVISTGTQSPKLRHAASLPTFLSSKDSAETTGSES